MTKPAFRLAAMGALALLYSAAPIGQAQAAEGHDNCKALLRGPIYTPGTYCMSADMASSLTTGAAITIAADNVTIDCNGHVVRNMSPPETNVIGVLASGRENVTVRNCKIDGFMTGVRISDGSGHLVEKNLVTESGESGIYLSGTQNSVVRLNRVSGAGAYSSTGSGWGIRASAHVRDNVVQKVHSIDNIGIAASGNGNEIRGNTVRGMRGDFSFGIVAEANGMIISGNHVTGNLGIVGISVKDSNTYVGNTATGFKLNYDGPAPGLDNL